MDRIPISQLTPTIKRLAKRHQSDTIIVTHYGKPVAKLVPITEEQAAEYGNDPSQPPFRHLTDAQVRDIRYKRNVLSLPIITVAADYGIEPSYVSHLATGRRRRDAGGVIVAPKGLDKTLQNPDRPATSIATVATPCKQ